MKLTSAQKQPKEIRMKETSLHRGDLQLEFGVMLSFRASPDLGENRISRVLADAKFVQPIIALAAKPICSGGNNAPP